MTTPGFLRILNFFLFISTLIPPAGGPLEIQVNDPLGTIGLCLGKHDLAFSKLAAGREKDIEFIRE